MITLYINGKSGVSGDMMLAAFISLGVPQNYLTTELKKLGLNEFRLEINEKVYRNRKVTDVNVIILNKRNLWKHPYSGKYRNYGEIKEIIESSQLSETSKHLSRKIFDIKALAESKVHGVEINQVQFHEVGAVDSIVDIVGSSICYSYLNIDKTIAEHVPTGYGTIKCRCGILPVPAPAVIEILKTNDIPSYKSNVEKELLTPTGAAILAGIVDEYVLGFDCCLFEKEGYGVGKRDTGLEPLELKIIRNLIT